MKNTMVNELIKTMKERTPKGSNLANFLMETLCMGKEAVYRRLRGEVAFTFDEVAIISQRMNISLDKIVGNQFSNGAIFDLGLLHASEPLDNYYNILFRYHKLFEYIKDDPSTSVSTAANLIPYTFYSAYENLSKFRLCRWMYQNEKVKAPTYLTDMRIPEKVTRIERELNDTIKKAAKTCFIWDSNVFVSFVKEIKYFAELNLISQTDVVNLKNELHQLLTELEFMSIKGRFDNGNLLSIYLSNINFEATYSYVEKTDFQICLFRVYSINSMDSQNTKICEIQKNWIDSLKRHSTLISQSGEKQRITFFNEQRRIIDTV